VAEEDWEERHRGRQWLAADEAAARLKQKELRGLVKTLESVI
jgi:hypothetical protein